MNVITVILICLVCISNSYTTELNWENMEDIFDGADCLPGEIIATETGPYILKHGPALYAISREISSNLEQNGEVGSNAFDLLNVLTRKNKIRTQFVVAKEEGLPHDKTFLIELSLGDEFYSAVGKSIKKAKQAAAEIAISQTKYIVPKLKKMQKQKQPLPPTVELNNFATKLGMKVEYINENILDQYDLMNSDHTTNNYYSLDQHSKSFLTKLNDSIKYSGQFGKMPYEKNLNRLNQGPFRIRLVMGGHTFFGHGLTIQAARHEAARNGLTFFQNLPLHNLTECLNEGILCDKLQIKTPVSILQEIAVQRQLHVNYALVDESGPSHQKKFIFACTADNLLVHGEGATKKKAKHKAAEKMLEKLYSGQQIAVENKILVETTSKGKKTKKKKTPRKGFLRKTASSVMNYIQESWSSGSSETGSSGVDKLDDHNSYKNKLLKMCQQIGVNVMFSTFKSANKCTSVVTLHAELSHICHDKGEDEAETEEGAAFKALKFIEDMGLNNIKVPLTSKENQQIIVQGINSRKTDEEFDT